MKVYGIVNCNTVMAARAWLDANKRRYEFVDYKRTPPTREQLVRWCAAFGWENVLNRRGTTWRSLPPAEQTKVTSESAAIALMLAKPTMIKRPIIEDGKELLIGFDQDRYRQKLRPSPMQGPGRG